MDTENFVKRHSLDSKPKLCLLVRDQIVTAQKWDPILTTEI